MNSAQQKSMSTSLDSLPAGNENNTNNNDDKLVDNILREISDDNQQQNPEMQQMSYQMDPQTKIPAQNDQMQNQNQMQNQMQMEAQMQQMQQMQLMQQNQMDMGMPETVSNQTMTQKIIEQVKNPLIVAIICIALSLPMTSSLIVKYVPKTADAVTGNINILGLVLKGIVAGLIYFGLIKFI